MPSEVPLADRLTDMRVFARVARLESFAAAARELRMSGTAVSRRVSELEEGLGVRLLQRTTRRLRLTEEGAAYLERCERILEEIEDLESSVSAQRASPRGRLRVAAGVSFAQEQLVPLLPDFLERHPDLTVDLEMSDRFIDLVAEGIDVAIRVGRLADSGLVARRLATSHAALCASPDYLARAGMPGTPEDLAHHAFVVDRNAPRTLELEGPGGLHRFVPEGRLYVNSAHATRDAVRMGLGIGQIPTFVSGADLASGRLVPILPDYRTTEAPIHAVYPPNRHLSSRVRVWVDHLAAHFGDPPGWDAWS